MLPFLLFFTFAFASNQQNDQISKYFDQKLSEISSKSKWATFLQNNKENFPDLNTKSEPITVVNREELKIENDTFSIGIGFREAFVKTSLSNYKTFLANPELFKSAYGLDGDANLPDSVISAHEFKARIFKKIPGLEDQDYVLKYNISKDGVFYFIRASLLEDKRGFALRDNLKILEEVKDGVIVRELSYVYPLRWWVRLFGNTTQSIMKKELTKVSLAEKCILEGDQNQIFDHEHEKACWKKFDR